jgi:hypothetical protein
MTTAKQRAIEGAKYLKLKIPNAVIIPAQQPRMRRWTDVLKRKGPGAC